MHLLCLYSTSLLHFAWGIPEAKCILVTAVCVYLSLAAFPHYFTDPDVSWGMVGVPSSCALLGGFANGARVSLLWQHSAKCKMSAIACIRSMPDSFCQPHHIILLTISIISHMAYMYDHFPFTHHLLLRSFRPRLKLTCLVNPPHHSLLVMVAIWNRADHYIFILSLSSSFFFFLA